jgi:hypothetical protein
MERVGVRARVAACVGDETRNVSFIKRARESFEGLGQEEGLDFCLFFPSLFLPLSHARRGGTTASAGGGLACAR